MSGSTGGLHKGDIVYYKEKWRTIEEYIHVSTGMHNDDRVIFLFTDGTTTGSYGLWGIETKTTRKNKSCIR